MNQRRRGSPVANTQLLHANWTFHRDKWFQADLFWNTILQIQLKISEIDFLSSYHFPALWPLHLHQLLHRWDPIILVPQASHRAEMELMEDIFWERKALQANLANSALHKPVVMIFSSLTQCLYISWTNVTAFSPSGVATPPIKMRSGFSRLRMDDPFMDHS